MSKERVRLLLLLWWGSIGIRSAASLRAPAFPEIVRPGRHKSKLDPYKDYLNLRVQAGQRNATHLVVELREQGYRGGSTIVRD